MLASHNAAKLREVKAVLAACHVRLSSELCGSYKPPEEDRECYAGNSLLKAKALWRHGAAELSSYGILADDSGIEVDVLGGAPGVRSARYAGNQATADQNIAHLLRQLQNPGDVGDLGDLNDMNNMNGMNGMDDHPPPTTSISGRNFAELNQGRMCCVMTYIPPNQDHRLTEPRYIQVSGRIDGWISPHPQINPVDPDMVISGYSDEAQNDADAQRYFGYDPIFIPHLSSQVLDALVKGLGLQLGRVVRSSQLHQLLAGRTYGQWPHGWKNMTSHRFFALNKLKDMLKDANSCAASECSVLSDHYDDSDHY